MAKVGAVSIHYQVKGLGTPILFIHPPLLTGENFLYQRVQLSPKYQVITFDIRGHGKSQPSPVPITYPLIVEDMIGLMNALHMEKALVCGYSTGGGIALEALLRHPDRFTGGIVVSGMPETGDLWLAARIRTAIGLCDIKWKSLLAKTIAFGNADCSATYRLLYKDAMLGHVGSWEQYYRSSLEYSCTERLGGIRSPVLLLYGRRDISFYKYARTLQKGLIRNDIHWLKKMAHQIPTKGAQEMNEVIKQWISSHRLDMADKREASDLRSSDEGLWNPGVTEGLPLQPEQTEEVRVTE